MSLNNDYQQKQEIASSISSSTKDLLLTKKKDILCNDCGGISVAKVQRLLKTLDGTTQLFNRTASFNSTIENSTKSNKIYRKNHNRLQSRNKKNNSARNNSRKTSLRLTMKNKDRITNTNKRIQHSNIKRKLKINRIRSSISAKRKNDKNRTKSKYNGVTKIKRLSSKTK
ncbi:unnamed protein product [Rotaria socialis]|uniref:Uncharacterized protein n=1 Tax=Rotaria socialis TaxID=392032 RepID=A0A820H725_9BILA|nr:unnamed protein product [Rotaria socialis]CAF3228225.1 unnamed protein product [Rotaria socialis]CAF3480618.1 unnamed protein product [Rotaria socialis]CAF3525161.1 unnamed protein product [Rotaria socialis]CAF3734619.1 unnamed protein product [Rotaria socialis]